MLSNMPSSRNLAYNRLVSLLHLKVCSLGTWVFPEIRDTFGEFLQQGLKYLGCILGSPIQGNYHMRLGISPASKGLPRPSLVVSGNKESDKTI